MKTKTKIDVISCYHCKKFHEGLELKKMKKELFDAGERYTHYAICPDTSYMILITTEDAHEPVED